MSQDYKQVVVSKSPEEEAADFDEMLAKGEGVFNWLQNQIKEPLQLVWTLNDATWTYIDKFNVFWFREWVSDCTVVRAALQELRHYQVEGEVLAPYRTTDEEIVLKHLRTIADYWD